MPADLDHPVLLRFGSFELDIAGGVLRKNGTRVAIQPQPLRVLSVLAAHPGKLVSREELKHEVWNGLVFVDFEQGLNFCIRRIRTALDDSADSPRFLETVPRRGYRFVAPVERIEPSENAQATATTYAAVSSDKRGKRVEGKLWRIERLAIALVVAAASVFWFAQRWENAAPTERRLTANPEEAAVRAAVISPDGKYLAYEDTTGLYVKQVQTGEIRRLSLPRGVTEVLPDSWFPDSTDFIATGSADSSHQVALWKFSVLGGEPRNLVENAFQAAISPDGQRIAFLRGGPDYERLGREVWVMSTSGGEISRISDGSQGPKYFTSLAWSPTADQLAYVRLDPDLLMQNTALMTQPIGVSSARVLISAVQPVICWTADGRIIFEQRAKSSKEEPAMFAVQVESHTGQAKGTPARIAASGEFLRLSGTADGRNLMLLRADSHFQIFLSEWLDSKREWRPLRRLSFDQHTTRPWAWTPDSKSIIVTSDRNGRQELFTQNIDSTTPELLATNEAQVKVARMMPEGKDVLFSQLVPDPSGTVKIFRVPLSGGQPQPMFSGRSINNFQCARLPSHLCVFDETRNATKVLIAYDSHTGTQRYITNLSDDPYGTDWNLSPDGSSIAILLGERIRLVSVTSGTTRDIVVHGWKDLQAIDWSPNSGTVLVANRTPGRPSTLLQVDLEGNARALFQSPRNMPMIWSVPSPDGKYQAVMAVVGSNNVSLLQNY